MAMSPACAHVAHMDASSATAHAIDTRRRSMRTAGRRSDVGSENRSITAATVHRKKAPARLRGAFFILPARYSVLQSRRRGAFGEWPRVVGELQHQEAVVLARRPKRARSGIEMNLGVAPVG